MLEIDAAAQPDQISPHGNTAGNATMRRQMQIMQPCRPSQRIGPLWLAAEKPVAFMQLAKAHCKACSPVGKACLQADIADGLALGPLRGLPGFGAATTPTATGGEDERSCGNQGKNRHWSGAAGASGHMTDNLIHMTGNLILKHQTRLAANRLIFLMGGLTTLWRVRRWSAHVAVGSFRASNRQPAFRSRILPARIHDTFFWHVFLARLDVGAISGRVAG